MDIEQPSDPLRSCAYSGVELPESQMVRIGDHYVALEWKEEAVQYLQQGNDLASRVPRVPQDTPLKLWPLLRRSGDLSIRHFWLLVALRLTVALPERLLGMYLLYHVIDPVARDLKVMVGFSILMIDSFGTAAVVAAMKMAWSGLKPEYSAAWLAVARRAWAVICASILSLLFTVAGILLCVVPGMFAVVSCMFSHCFVIDEGQGGMQCFASSHRLARGRFLRLIGYLFLVLVVAEIPFFVIAFGTPFLPRSWRTWQNQAVIVALGSLPQAFMTVFIFVSYKALRALDLGEPSKSATPPSESGVK